MFSTANYTSMPNVVKTKIQGLYFFGWKWYILLVRMSSFWHLHFFTSLGAKVQLTSSPFHKTLSVNIENSSPKLIVGEIGRAAPLHCFLRGVQASTHKGSHLSLPFGITDIEGYMLTTFATGFALQYCRLMDVRVLWSACRAEHPSGFSQSSVVVENDWFSSSTIWTEKIWSFRFTSFAVACEWGAPPRACGKQSEVKQFIPTQEGFQ